MGFNGAGKIWTGGDGGQERGSGERQLPQHRRMGRKVPEERAPTLLDSCSVQSCSLGTDPILPNLSRFPWHLILLLVFSLTSSPSSLDLTTSCIYLALTLRMKCPSQSLTHQTLAWHLYVWATQEKRLIRSRSAPHLTPQHAASQCFHSSPARQNWVCM